MRRRLSTIRPTRCLIGGLVLVLGTVSLAACSASGSEVSTTSTTSTSGPIDDLDVCEILTGPAPGPIDLDQLADDGIYVGDGSVGHILGWFAPSTLYIYLDSRYDDDDLAAFAERVRAQPGAGQVHVVGRAESFEEFQKLFADQPDMLASVRADQLPLRVHVRLDRAEQLAPLERWAEGQPEIYEVRGLLGPTDLRAQLAVAFGADRQREGWRALAADLVETGEPWAADAKALIDEVLSEGTYDRSTAEGHARLAGVQDGVRATLEDCG